MMSLRDGPYHKMWAGEMINLRHYPGRPEKPQQHREEGYTLVALLAVMTVLALFALAAAPSIRQQAQREREIEAIYRGEQMAEAIRVYYSYQQSRVGPGDPALPTSVEKLLEGLPSGTKKVQILR